MALDVGLNILFVTPYLPSPPGFGGARRIQGLMAGLARSHHVSVLSLVNTHESHAHSVEATGAYAHQVWTVPNHAFSIPRTGKRALQLRSLGSRKSFEWRTHVLPEMEAELRAVLGRNRYDVVNFEFSQMAPYRRVFDGAPGRPAVVLDEHNIEFEILRRTAASETAIGRRIYNSVNWRKLRLEEVSAWRDVDGCAVTSAHDQELLLKELPQTRTAIVPNAVDLDFFKPRPDAPPPEPGSILFFGANNYFPNADGLRFFLNEIFPLVRKALPAAKLKVVGHTPDQLRALANEFVEMKGFVPDLRAEIERAAVVIAPLRVGGGTRLKILEAMAMARPVVSTRQGAEGLDVVDGKQILLADAPEAFAAKVVQVLQDEGLARRLGEAARQLVVSRYGWDASVAQLEALYHDVLARRASGLPSA